MLVIWGFLIILMPGHPYRFILTRTGAICLEFLGLLGFLGN